MDQPYDAMLYRDQEIADLKRKVQRLSMERCHVCNGELSYCGELDADGEPTLGCSHCQKNRIWSEVVQRREKDITKLEAEIEWLRFGIKQVIEWEMETDCRSPGVCKALKRLLKPEDELCLDQ